MYAEFNSNGSTPIAADIARLPGNSGSPISIGIPSPVPTLGPAVIIAIGIVSIALALASMVVGPLGVPVDPDCSPVALATDAELRVGNAGPVPSLAGPNKLVLFTTFCSTFNIFMIGEASLIGVTAGVLSLIHI